jgi:hypothetical protein
MGDITRERREFGLHSKPRSLLSLCILRSTRCCKYIIYKALYILLSYHLLTELSPSEEAANCAATPEAPSNFKESKGSLPY